MNLSRILMAGFALALITPAVSAQKVYGLDGFNTKVHEYPMLPGAPCGQPVPTLTTWNYSVPPPCPGPVAGPTPPPGLDSWGDIATDSLGDTVFVCDGFVIEEYAELNPFKGTLPGTAINSFFAPLVSGLPVTGMGMDETGLFTAGMRTLWLTDGFDIWGIIPSAPGTCANVGITVPPFNSPFPVGPGALLTDVTWDPSSQTLLACDQAGFIHSIVVGGGPGPYGYFPVGGGPFCNLTPSLEGIAMDLATTPSVLGLPPAFYVTDGFTLAYLDVTPALATPTFYTPVPCRPTTGPHNGLAYVNHSINFGAGTGAKFDTFGQPSSPGPTYGITITSPAPAFAWALFGSNIPGPGYFCPPIVVVGNPLYVDALTPPGGYFPLGPVGAGQTSLPAPIPAGLPPGVEAYFQVFLDMSPGIPGGPWRATDAVDLVITAP
jgi:hypothetical protein